MSLLSPSATSDAAVGLGATGSRVAGWLLAAGHDVTVSNRSAANRQPLVELGASAAATPAEVARSHLR